jgi:hypothetical protein
MKINVSNKIQKLSIPIAAGLVVLLAITLYIEDMTVSNILKMSGVIAGMLIVSVVLLRRWAARGEKSRKPSLIIGSIIGCVSIALVVFSVTANAWVRITRDNYSFEVRNIWAWEYSKLSDNTYSYGDYVLVSEGTEKSSLSESEQKKKLKNIMKDWSADSNGITDSFSYTDLEESTIGLYPAISGYMTATTTSSTSNTEYSEYEFVFYATDSEYVHLDYTNTGEQSEKNADHIFNSVKLV